MKRKVLAVLLASTMVLGLAACGSSDDKKTEDTSKDTEKTEDTAKDEGADAEASINVFN